MNRKQNWKWTIKVLLTGLLAALVLTISACGSNGKTNDPSTSKPQNNAAESTNGNTGAAAPDSTSNMAETVYPLTVKDATGTEITLNQAPEHVVSLAPSDTEALFAIDAGDQVAGVDEYSNYPAEALKKPKVGDMNTNIEAVAALKPDLVVASSSMNKDAVEQLRKLGITVYASDPKTLDETIDHITQVGELVNHKAKAAEVADGMREVKQQVIDTVKDAPKKKVYLEFSPGYSVGKGEFLDDLVTLAGGTNIAADQTGWFKIDPEKILTANPEVIIYPEIKSDTTIPDAVNSRPGWDQIDAVKNKQVYAVANDPLVRVGPRLTDGLMAIAKAIHPDLFK